MNQSPSDELFQDDYFFGETDEVTKSRRVYALIIYDIIDNKKRTKFASFMKGFGSRVQKSGFEAVISHSKFEKMLKGIGRYADPEDSIRVYRIQGKSQVYQWGKPGPTEEEDVIVL